MSGRDSSLPDLHFWFTFSSAIKRVNKFNNPKNGLLLCFVLLVGKWHRGVPLPQQGMEICGWSWGKSRKRTEWRHGPQTLREIQSLQQQFPSLSTTLLLRQPKAAPQPRFVSGHPAAMGLERRLVGMVQPLCCTTILPCHGASGMGSARARGSMKVRVVVSAVPAAVMAQDRLWVWWQTEMWTTTAEGRDWR